MCFITNIHNILNIHIDKFYFDGNFYPINNNVAIKKSSETLSFFKSDLIEFSNLKEHYVRVKLINNKTEEFIWLKNLSFDNEGIVYGTLLYKSNKFSHLYPNKKVGVLEKEIVDWTIIHNNELIGAYTLQPIFKILKRIDTNFFNNLKGNLKIHQKVDIQLLQAETPETVVNNYINAIINNDLDSALKYKNFYKEAEFLLDRNVDYTYTLQDLKRTAFLLELSFIDDFETNNIFITPSINGLLKQLQYKDSSAIIERSALNIYGEKETITYHTYKSDNQWKIVDLFEDKIS